MSEEMGLINTEIINEDELVFRAEMLLGNIGKSIPKRFEAIKAICDDLAQLSPIKQEVYINEISSKLKVTKKELTIQLKESIVGQNSLKVADRDDEKAGVPHITILENFISDHYSIRYDQVANKYEYAIKSLDNGKKKLKWEELNEFNIIRKLKKAHIKISQIQIIEILKSDFTPRHNPISDYFKNLPEWDGKNHIKKLGDYLSIKNRDRFDRMFCKMFVRSVACALEYNFNKQVFTFVGEGERNQNMGKSTLIRWLVPKELQDYYTEEIPKDKDGLISLSENFIINLDELSTLNKMEINWLKSLLSKDKIKMRLPYDKRASTLKRRCSFWASTNEAEFLSDLTGNVRWICFYIKDIDFNYDKDIDINQVWSQAYHYLRKGINNSKFNYQLTPEEIQENERANQMFMRLPSEMELIQHYYAPATKECHHAFYTATDFVTNLATKTNGSIRLYPNLVGKALNSLGFPKGEMRIDGSPNPSKGYYINILTREFQGQDNNPH